MIEAVGILARFAQYVPAAILFGAPLFFLYGLPADGPVSGARLSGPKPIFVVSAALLLLGSIVALAAQTATLTGDLTQAFQPSALWDVASGAGFGIAMGLRGVLALALGTLLLALRPSRRLWLAMAVLGLAALASFAWSGHGAADDGVGGCIHLVDDVVHLIAAGVWLGALAALAMALATRGLKDDPAAAIELHGALAGFSGIGSLAVSALLITGLINGAFLVGPSHVFGLASSAYGWVLLIKLAVFTVMVALAAANRFVLTPHLRDARDDPARAKALAALARSIGWESGAGVFVLALVSILGTLTPLSAS